MLIFDLVSKSLGLPAGLLAALCHVESNHNPAAINWHDYGAPSYGLCQLKLSTARMFAPRVQPAQLLDPEINAIIAGLYLRRQYRRYRNWDKAIGAYNCGRLCLTTNGTIKNRKYIEKVKARMK